MSTYDFHGGLVVIGLHIAYGLYIIYLAIGHLYRLRASSVSESPKLMVYGFLLRGLVRVGIGFVLYQAFVNGVFTLSQLMGISLLLLVLEMAVNYLLNRKWLVKESTE